MPSGTFLILRSARSLPQARTAASRSIRDRHPALRTIRSHALRGSHPLPARGVRGTVGPNVVSCAAFGYTIYEFPSGNSAPVFGPVKIGSGGRQFPAHGVKNPLFRRAGNLSRKSLFCGRRVRSARRRFPGRPSISLFFYSCPYSTPP